MLHKDTQPISLKVGKLDVVSYVSPKDYEKDKQYIDPDLVDRRTLTGMPAMQSTALLSIVAPGSDLEVKEIPLCSAMQSMPEKKETIKVDSISNIEIDVIGRWLPPEIKAAQASDNASIFGHLGCFEMISPVVQTLELPTVDLESVPEEDLRVHYKATRLTPTHSSYPNFNSHDKNLYMIVYSYNENYLSEYAMQPSLGAGIFIEYHNFPHLFKPLSSECNGAVILGRKVSEDEKTGVGHYKLVSLKINYPDSIVIEAGVIHGNAAFVGPYVISSTTSGKGSIVAFRTNNGSMQSVTQPDYYSSERFFKQKSLDKASPHESTTSKLDGYGAKLNSGRVQLWSFNQSSASDAEQHGELRSNQVCCWR